MVEEDGTEQSVHLRVSPMLAQNIGRVAVTANVVKLKHFRCNRLPGVVEGKDLVPFVELGVWD